MYVCMESIAITFVCIYIFLHQMFEKLHTIRDTVGSLSTYSTVQKKLMVFYFSPQTSEAVNCRSPCRHLQLYKELLSAIFLIASVVT